MFARRRFEFPHFVLQDRDGNDVAIVQLEATLIGRQLVFRVGRCGHPRWRHWWIPVRVLRSWCFTVVPDDVEQLKSHKGSARFRVRPRGAKLESVEIRLPDGVEMDVLNDATGGVIE